MRFEFLDGLRGVAALSVVSLHLAVVGLVPSFFPSAFLAVDFFFVLSGFVITHAYSERLATAAMTFREFAIARMIRLYPLALLGSVMGMVVLLAKLIFFPDTVGGVWAVSSSGLFNLLLLPNFFSGEDLRYELFPVNGPLWTLFLELFASLVFAVTLMGASWGRLLSVMLVSGVGIICGYLSHGPVNLGYDAHTFAYGVARVAFGFSTGIAIHRLMKATDTTMPFNGAMSALFLISILAISFAVHSTLLCILATLFLFPFVVWAASYITVKARMFRILGDLSYPLYALHFPILIAASGVLQVFPALSSMLVTGLAVTMLIPIAWIALKLCDVPVRRRLTAVFATSIAARQVWGRSSPGVMPPNRQEVARYNSTRSQLSMISAVSRTS